jgi:hypothetical protein
MVMVVDNSIIWHDVCWCSLDQTTVKKDQDDEHNGLREDLWNSIRNAYLHPTLQPVELDIHENSNNMESLLPSSSKRVSKV